MRVGIGVDEETGLWVGWDVDTSNGNEASYIIQAPSEESARAAAMLLSGACEHGRLGSRGRGRIPLLALLAVVVCQPSPLRG